MAAATPNTSKFYAEYQDECCLGTAVGRVPLRIVGGLCLGFGAISIGLDSYVYTCYDNIVYAGINTGGWWAGVLTIFTGLFGVYAFNRGVVITANAASIIGITFSVIAALFDRDGIDALQTANTTNGYCKQTLAAAFVFDIVIGLMNSVMFIVTFLSLCCPGCFQELSFETLRDKDQRQQVYSEHDYNHQRQQQQRQQEYEQHSSNVDRESEGANYEHGHQSNYNSNAYDDYRTQDDPDRYSEQQNSQPLYEDQL